MSTGLRSTTTVTTPIGLWSRTDLRARWRSLAVLGVLAGLTAGLALAALDGAQRTGSALSRLERRNQATDAVVFASQGSLDVPNWEKLSHRPEVSRIARWTLVFGLVDGVDSVLIAPSDQVFMNELDRPVVVAGRMFDRSAPNEVVVTDDQPPDGVAPTKVGDIVHLDAYATFDPVTGPTPGPPFDLTVVGVIHTSLSYEFTGGLYLSPAFLEKNAAEVMHAENAMVDLRNGQADIAALRRDASTDVFPGVPVLDFHVTARRITATTEVERAMLALLSLVIALAGLAFVGQAMARSASSIGADAPTLRALGMTRRQLTSAAIWPHVLTATVAAAVTALTAIIASRWFPVGLAGRVDADRGIRVNVVLVVGAVALVVLLILAEVAIAGWLAAGADGRIAVTRPSWLARLGLVRPLTFGIGARMALESGRRTDGRNSRFALVGAVAAVCGVVAILTLSHGLADALRNPEVAGVAWDASVVANPGDVSSSGLATKLDNALRAQPGVASFAAVGRLVVKVGEVGVPAFTVIDGRSDEPVRLVTLAGRSPLVDDEVTLGPSTARDLGVGIGDSLALADGRTATVVGLGLFPSDVHAQFDEGVLVTNRRFVALASAGGDEYSVAVRFRDRADIAGQVDALGRGLAGSVQYVASVELPAELTNLHNVQRLPTVLSVFVTLLGVVAVGHALFSSVRRRRKDFAVLRALGITRRGAKLVLAAQGSVVAVVGLVLGVPLGLAAGRSGWRAITDRVPLTFRSPIALVPIVLVIPVAIVAANALALWPGLRAAKLEPATVLRSE